MPRTKRATKENLSENTKPNKDVLVRDMLTTYLKEFDAKATMMQIDRTTKTDQVIVNLNALVSDKFMKYRKYDNKTMNEFKNMVYSDSTTVNSVTMNSTKGRSRKSRSVSAGRRGRLSRTASTLKKKPRSLSRQNVSKLTNKFITPAHNPSIPNYGVITPKVRSNTPQVLVRRPQQGEIAVSVQGSPLMVDHMVSTKLNANIPLEDGRVLSILPERGLRTSQIPNIDPHIREQLQTLRDNLSQVLKCQK
ncbi:hypothetical protein FQR65_LT04256 [Abscondita terminalis]|nr:hypothetical protein FQR65_LT04256 [Abscondita terminalis]